MKDTVLASHRRCWKKVFPRAKTYSDLIHAIKRVGSDFDIARKHKKIKKLLIRLVHLEEVSVELFITFPRTICGFLCQGAQSTNEAVLLLIRRVSLDRKNHGLSVPRLLGRSGAIPHLCRIMGTPNGEFKPFFREVCLGLLYKMLKRGKSMEAEVWKHHTPLVLGLIMFFCNTEMTKFSMYRSAWIMRLLLTSEPNCCGPMNASWLPVVRKMLYSRNAAVLECAADCLLQIIFSETSGNGGSTERDCSTCVFRALQVLHEMSLRPRPRTERLGRQYSPNGVIGVIMNLSCAWMNQGGREGGTRDQEERVRLLIQWKILHSLSRILEWAPQDSELMKGALLLGKQLVFHGGILVNITVSEVSPVRQIMKSGMMEYGVRCCFHAHKIKDMMSIGKNLYHALCMLNVVLRRAAATFDSLELLIYDKQCVRGIFQALKATYVMGADSVSWRGGKAVSATIIFRKAFECLGPIAFYGGEDGFRLRAFHAGHHYDPLELLELHFEQLRRLVRQVVGNCDHRCVKQLRELRGSFRHPILESAFSPEYEEECMEESAMPTTSTVPTPRTLQEGFATPSATSMRQAARDWQEHMLYGSGLFAGGYHQGDPFEKDGFFG